MSIRFGIIGCGNVSGTYLYCLKNNEHAKVAAVCDLDRNRATEKAECYKVEGIYSDYRDMILHEELDAVVIATPHFLHHEQAVFCSGNGVDILCEKPLATRLDDIEDMLEKCKDVRFGVMLQRRCYPSSLAVRDIIRKGGLGKIIDVDLKFSCHKDPSFYSGWRGKMVSGGGTLISQALHRIDQLVFFFGEPIWVEGITKKTRDYIEVEDYAKGIVMFENNVMASIESNNSSGDPETRSIISIKGTEGEIILSDDKVVLWDVRFEKPSELEIDAIPSGHRPQYYGPGHEIIISDFVNSIIEERMPLVKGNDALPAMRIIFDFYKSAAEGRRVFLIQDT